MLGQKEHRLCPIQNKKKVVCDGICKSSEGMCAVYVRRFDVVVNCKKRYIHNP